MELKVITKETVLSPSICDGVEGGFSIVFRQPTQSEVVKMLSVGDASDMLEFLDTLFVRFDGDKPKVIDENGVEIPYKTFGELMAFTSGQLSTVLAESLEKFKEIREQALTIEKK